MQILLGVEPEKCSFYTGYLMPLTIKCKRATYTGKVVFQYLETFLNFPLNGFIKEWYFTSASASFCF